MGSQARSQEFAVSLRRIREFGDRVCKDTRSLRGFSAVYSLRELVG